MAIIGEEEVGVAGPLTSETDLCNDALGQVGLSMIGSLDEQSNQARRCRIFYYPLRDGLQRMHKWNFCLQRVTLAQAAVAPIGFTYAYQLPSDCLRVWEFNGSGIASLSSVQAFIEGHFNYHYAPTFKLEKRQILSNEGTAAILYSQRNTNPSEWDPLFYQVVATWLAGKLAMGIPKSGRLANDLIAQAVNVLLPMALAADGQEGSTEPFYSGSLIVGR